MPTDLIAIGKIVAPHGVRGDVRVTPLTDFPDRFLTMKEVLVGETRLLPIEEAKFHKQFLLLKFRGINDRDAVDALRGQLLSVRREDLVPLADGDFYVFDLMGMKVFTPEGERLGTISDVIETGSNDVYVVERPGNRPLLVPALKKIVTTVDVAAKMMVIRPPEEWDADED
jgi:16S rRNA processing protein RimM